MLKSSKANQQTVNDENKTAPPRKPKTERKNILNEKSKADVDWTQAGSDIAPEKPSERINEITSATVIQNAKKSKQNLYLLLGFFLIAISLIVAIIWALQKNQPNPSLTSDHEAIADEPSEPANQSDNDMAAKRQSEKRILRQLQNNPRLNCSNLLRNWMGRDKLASCFPNRRICSRLKKRWTNVGLMPSRICWNSLPTHPLDEKPQPASLSTPVDGWSQVNNTSKMHEKLICDVLLISTRPMSNVCWILLVASSPSCHNTIWHYWRSIVA